jgi:hypothetical protein
MIVMDLEFARFTAQRRRRYTMENMKWRVNYYRKERGSVEKNIRIRQGAYSGTLAWLSVLGLSDSLSGFLFLLQTCNSFQWPQILWRIEVCAKTKVGFPRGWEFVGLNVSRNQRGSTGQESLSWGINISCIFL